MINPSPTQFAIAYGVCVFLSFFILIPASINSQNMRGNCLLTAKGYWNETNELVVTWGHRSACNFIVFMGVACLLSSLYFFWNSIYSVCKGYDGCWKVDLGNFNKEYHVNSDDFSSDLEIIEFGSWSSTLSWLAATVLSFFKVRYYHKNEELIQGLALEKDSLIPYRLRYQKIDEGSSYT